MLKQEQRERDPCIGRWEGREQRETLCWVRKILQVLTSSVDLI